MAFLEDAGTLEDALSGQAQNASNSISQQYAKKRRQSVAQAAHSGRLGSGVYNYTAGDIDASETSALGDVQSALSSALAEIPIGDYGMEQDNARKLQLAKLLGNQNKPSALEEALSALSTAGQIGATFAAFV